ncbi:Acetylpolyamine aminohydrolase [Pseudovibrio axinellae]|uniref:Acetylpolyamine aminohydrolase n=1 Tax=Pseudovibrio axinellae TaxID=989403 RepID=A0A166B8C1_9HYPH|nr:histone deacetylase family protein [Pseudovibrio axinellae]KZL22010.1 Acetylpolyamine aminohydrolase [Pseudovibrio axinellae]SEQ58867.1 Acetoin utilization deacetylase AcuC [Pseudovibrio axinellae]
MKTIFSPDQLLHAPTKEISDGKLVAAHEVPARAEIILEHIRKAQFGEIQPPKEFTLNAILKVHDTDYVHFLQDFWKLWQEAGRTEEEVFPFVWPVHGLRHDIVPDHIDGKLGFYSFDAGSPMGAHTWTAARSSAETALTGADLILSGEGAAFALCRPPGHHAHRRLYGGYCFLNNAAIAAQHLRDQGVGKVTILDVDYHHGNGTQAIFYDRADVQFLSIHADPKVEFPYYLGHANERGLKEGAGYNHNYPLPHGTSWDKWGEALEDACRTIMKFAPDVVIVSLGMDPYENDPISQFRLKTDDFTRIGARIAQLGCPTLFVMEGGYLIGELGVNCTKALSGYLDAEKISL